MKVPFDVKCEKCGYEWTTKIAINKYKGGQDYKKCKKCKFNNRIKHDGDGNVEQC